MIDNGEKYQSFEIKDAHEPIPSQEYYSHTIQMLIDFYNNGELTNVDRLIVEPRYGYLASVQYNDGSSRIIYGQNRGSNSGSSESLSADKGYTKFMLRELGINCPDGQEFLLPWWAESLRVTDKAGDGSHILDTSMAASYIDNELEYPVYVKPAAGSEGFGVNKVYEPSELDAIFASYEDERVKVAIVEKALSMPDYRLLVINGQVVNAYERQPMRVVGNGRSSIGNLITELNERFKSQNRKIGLEYRMPQIIKHIGRAGLTLSDIAAPDTIVSLTDVSNLSAGGVPVDVSDALNDRWRDLASRIAKGFNLRVCGVDLACSDITSSESDYSVIEVNSSPGTKHYMASSKEAHDKLRKIFLDMFNTPQSLSDV